MSGGEAVASDRLGLLPPLPRNESGPVFAEPWQAQAFALAVKLSDQGHFTWKEWANTLAIELRSAADRGEPDDGSRYYDHWLAALERLVTAKGLTSISALHRRKDEWTAAYVRTPHGTPVELESSNPTEKAWIVFGLACSVAMSWAMTAGRSMSSWGLSSLDMSYETTALLPAGFMASGAFGAVLGMRHALEPDHLAAVSTLLTGERSSARAAWLGACWGLGHTVTLLMAGAALILLRGEMPSSASKTFEVCVVLLLVGFGLRAVYQSARQKPPAPSHVHLPPGTQKRRGQWRIARRPLLVGAVHGLAGSGALTAILVTTLPSMVARLGYLALFGAGSIAGMAVLSGLLGWPIARMGNHRWIGRALSLLVGSLSIALGLSWSYLILGSLLQGSLPGPGNP